MSVSGAAHSIASNRLIHLFIHSIEAKFAVIRFHDELQQYVVNILASYQ